MTSFDHDKLKNKLLKDYNNPIRTNKSQIDTEKLYRELDDYFSDDNIVPSLSFLRKNKLYLLIVIIVFIGFSSLATYAYKMGTSYKNNAEIILVEAPKDNYKVKPEEPGGIVIPNTDKSVYDVMSSDDNVNKIKPKLVEEKIENVIVQSEHKDLISNIIDNLEEIETQEANIIELSDAKNIVNNLPLEKTNEKKVDLVKVTVDSKNKIEVTKENITQTKLNNKKEDKKSQNVMTKGNYMIQLGAFKTKQDAQSNWLNFQKKYKFLSDLNIDIEKADLEEKGTFYRLKAGYFVEENKARQTCNKLIENKQGCFVVKRK